MKTIAEPLAQLGERGVLGDEAPADPRRVGARSRAAPARGARDRRRWLCRPPVARVDSRGPRSQRLVGLADEHGAAVGLGDERDRADRGAVLAVELAHRVDAAASPPRRG